MVEILLYRHIDQIKRDEWDAMVPENVFVSHGWLKTIEETFEGNIHPVYVVAQRSEDLVGAAVCYFMNEDSDPFLDYIIFGRARRMISRLGISFLPALICWPLFSFGSHLMVKEASDPEKKGDVVSRLLDVIERCRSEYKPFLMFLNVMDQEMDLVRHHHFFLSQIGQKGLYIKRFYTFVSQRTGVAHPSTEGRFQTASKERSAI